MDDSIADAFPGDDPVARFVVSMSMAKNDIERALRDVLRAGEKDDPDFTYRVRLASGHLVEAMDSLNAYSQTYKGVRSLIGDVSAEAKADLKIVRGTLQKVGSDALQHLRDNTFHYPSPRTNYNPTSDEQLEASLKALTDRRAELHVEFDARHVTLSFADEVALALAIGKHAPEPADYAQQFEAARDGALAFVGWAQALALAYFESRGFEFGQPEFK